jgi:hypothetical protein
VFTIDKILLEKNIDRLKIMTSRLRSKAICDQTPQASKSSDGISTSTQPKNKINSRLGTAVNQREFIK